MRGGKAIDGSLTVCYFGLSSPEFSRNRIYREALRMNGVEIIDCFDSTPGWRKFVRLYKKHALLRGKYDVLVVAYPGHIIVWFAGLIATGPVIFDAFASLYEAEVLSRRPEKRYSLFALRMWFIDFLACWTAHRVLVETEAQVRYFRKLFWIGPIKCRRLFTGVDDSVFSYDLGIRKYDRFTVVFRGRFLPEAGARHVLRAAKILAGEPIDFRIYGNGLLERDIVREFTELALPNVTLDTKFHALEDLPGLMAPCHVSLGQLERHERLERTIPHKAFESLALKLPYVSARYAPVAELVTEGESALMFEPGNPEDLAEKILLLYRDRAVAERISENGRQTYLARASQIVLGREFKGIIQELLT